MYRRTRVLVEVLRRLPRPEQPSARYLARIRRELPRGLARVLLGPVGAEVMLRDITVPSTDTLLPARVYRPRAAADEALPLVVNLHGGGWVLGDLDTHDPMCRALCSGAGCVVVPVAYRLAPEHRFPAAFNDTLAAAQWVAAQEEALGINPARLAVGGDSAGGSLPPCARPWRAAHRLPAAALPDH